MTDDEREALAQSVENMMGYSGGKPVNGRKLAAQIRADGERIKALEAALRGLLASPAIADGGHGHHEWGCPETAEAERAARAALCGPMGYIECVPRKEVK